VIVFGWGYFWVGRCGDGCGWVCALGCFCVLVLYSGIVKVLHQIGVL